VRSRAVDSIDEIGDSVGSDSGSKWAFPAGRPFVGVDISDALAVASVSIVKPSELNSMLRMISGRSGINGRFKMPPSSVHRKRICTPARMRPLPGYPARCRFQLGRPDRLRAADRKRRRPFRIGGVNEINGRAFRGYAPFNHQPQQLKGVPVAKPKLDIENLSAISMRLYDKAEALDHMIAQRELAADMRLAARICDRLATMRFEITEIAARCTDAAIARDLRNLLDES
jgi:hypothetical protein